jgi:hypothetical protein
MEKYLNNPRMIEIFQKIEEAAARRGCSVEDFLHRMMSIDSRFEVPPSAMEAFEKSLYQHDELYKLLAK